MKKKPIKILRIIARLNIGGPAIQAINLTKAFSDKQFNSLLVCGKVSHGEGDMSYLAEKQEVFPVVIPELRRELHPVKDLKTFFKIRRIIKSFKPDIIHTHTAKAGTLGRMAAISINAKTSEANRIRLVHTFHGHIFHGYFNRFKTFIFLLIERFLAIYTDRIVVISPLQQKDICLKFKIADEKKVRVIRLGFNLDRFIIDKKLIESMGVKYFDQKGKEVFFVGIIGRLTRIKNHRMFLSAIRYLKDIGKIDPFKFMVVGDGEMKDELIKTSENLGIGEKIVFAGWQKDMVAIYSALNAVVLTSVNEGTPVTLIEAMAAGKPVIATDVGGVSDLLGNVINEVSCNLKIAENGILIPPDSPETLAEGLLFLLENRKMRTQLVYNAKKFVFDHYKQENLIINFKRLYTDLAHGKPG